MIGQQTDTLWVCTDCFFASQGLADEQDSTPDCEPLCLISESDEITAGMMMEEHATDCPNRPDWVGAECECETVSFSWHACHGCGSSLGGARYALTLWTD